MDNLEELLNFWGYTNVPGKNNEFGFFNYGEKAKKEYVDQFEAFKKLNEDMWKFVLDEKEKA